MADRTLTADVCVVGGGPAGSTAAGRLATLGFAVCLLESQPAPRPRLSASLPSTILPLLEHLGARDAFERAAWRRSHEVVVWWSSALPMRQQLPGPVCHVDRGELDHLLLAHAARSGVTVLQPARATRAQRRADGGWAIAVRSEGGPAEVSARFLVDASGGGALLPGRRTPTAPPLVAIYAEWVVAGGAPADGQIEAAEDAWSWCAPLADRRAVVAVFTDPARLARQRRHSLEAAYLHLLGGFRLWRRRSAVLAGPVRACAAAGQYADEMVGPDFIRVGDASVRLDPLSAQGVQSALVSGVQAATVLNTLVRCPADGDAALTFYRDRQREHAWRHARKTAGFYRERSLVCARPFWQQRAKLPAREPEPAIETAELDADCPIRRSPLVHVEQAATMQGDLIRFSPALRHQSWEKPVAFVDGIEVAPLLARIHPGQRARSAVDSWCCDVPLETAWKIMRWLWSRKVILPAPIA